MQELHNQKSAATGNATPSSGLDDPKTKADLGTLIDQAQKSLEHGLAGLAKSDEPNPSAVLAAIPLAELYVNQSMDNKAVALLEHAKYGPLTLLAKKDPTTQTEAVAAEIYKAALARTSAPIRSNWIKQRRRSMDWKRFMVPIRPPKQS